jgi:hypothetical protein
VNNTFHLKLTQQIKEEAIKPQSGQWRPKPNSNFKLESGKEGLSHHGKTHMDAEYYDAVHSTFDAIQL